MSLQELFQADADKGFAPDKDFGAWLQQENSTFGANVESDVNVVAAAAYAVWSTASENTLQVLLENLIDPNTGRPAFNEVEVKNALNQLYNHQEVVTIVVEASKKWQTTGVVISPSIQITTTYKGGSWTANPATGMVDANGNGTYVAKSGYTMPGAQEGALIGRVVQSETLISAPFLLGNSGMVPSELSGELQFCINDDLNHVYGDGFADNVGSVTIDVQSSGLSESVGGNPKSS